MPKYKYKFLVFTTKPVQDFGTRFTVARIDVSHLNEFQIGAKWNEMQKLYPTDTYLSSLTKTNDQMSEFVEHPNLKS